MQPSVSVAFLREESERLHRQAADYNKLGRYEGTREAVASCLHFRSEL
jgi:hypothetical protein